VRLRAKHRAESEAARLANLNATARAGQTQPDTAESIDSTSEQLSIQLARLFDWGCRLAAVHHVQPRDVFRDMMERCEKRDRT